MMIFKGAILVFSFCLFSKGSHNAVKRTLKPATTYEISQKVCSFVVLIIPLPTFDRAQRMPAFESFSEISAA